MTARGGRLPCAAAAAAAAWLIATGPGTAAAPQAADSTSRRYVPADLTDTRWLETLREAQVKALARHRGVPRFPVHRSTG